MNLCTHFLVLLVDLSWDSRDLPLDRSKQNQVISSGSCLVSFCTAPLLVISKILICVVVMLSCLPFRSKPSPPAQQENLLSLLSLLVILRTHSFCKDQTESQRTSHSHLQPTLAHGFPLTSTLPLPGFHVRSSSEHYSDFTENICTHNNHLPAPSSSRFQPASSSRDDLSVPTRLSTSQF